MKWKKYVARMERLKIYKEFNWKALREETFWNKRVHWRTILK
jgi:hypothetical protein